MKQYLHPIIKRDLRRSGQVLGKAGNTPLLFILLIMLLPLSMGPQAHMLQDSAGGILMVVLVFTVLLNIDVLFVEDWRDGTLDMIVMSGRTLGGYACAHMLAHWCMQALPLVVLAPLAAASLGVPLSAFGITALVLALASAIFILIGGIANALMLKARGGAFLLAFITMPFYVPALIFASASLQLAYRGLSPLTPLALLGALMVAVLVLAPLCIDKLLRWQNA
jgi:heme exporter protein B